ncbi:MAG: hypothetical protein E7Z91_00660 [Cyanobacteria bacterium SIG30]|nr:hypothetical protein [Cyanobacteria bacterium SIG30]
MNKIFEKKFGIIAKYFNTLFEENKKFPQAIVFESLDIFGQYFFALELARILNCMQEKKEDCTCTNCNWIKENKHPAIVTVSQIDFKEEGDTSKTVISIKQARKIINNLTQSSDFHRFFIFLDAKKGEMENHIRKQYEKWNDLGFELPDENWVPSFITNKTFHNSVPNALLKSIEEPPERTTFIFLTKNREDLINTITSRAMIFKLPCEKFDFDYSEIATFLEKYPNLDLEDAFTISEQLQEFSKEKDLLSREILNMIEQYIGNFLLNNPHSEKIKNDLKNVQKAKRRINASMTQKNVFESLFIDLATF